MKNKLVFSLLVFVIGVITVSAYTVDDFVNKVNNGEVTKAFVEKEKKEGCKVVINATSSGSSVNIAYHFTCEEEKEEVINNKKEKVKKETYNLDGSINYSMNGENILVSSLDRTEKEDKADPFYEKVISLTPYWGTEMSTKYSEISKYIKKNHKGDILEAFKEIFNKCYMEEMGVCYSKTPGMTASNYLGKIKMDDSGASYALKELKREQREIDNKHLIIRLGIIAGGLVVLIIVLKSLVPNPMNKRCKY